MMILYSSKDQAELNEGTVYGIENGKYNDIDEAIEDMRKAGYENKDSMFAFKDENGKIRVAWTIDYGC
jgi:hypothetical protein